MSGPHEHPGARRLAELLPGMLLAADAENPDRPLHRLLEVLAGPLEDLAAAVRDLERDPFVARASAEALPLLAELVGARLLGEDAPTNRRVVAGTVGWRRRKGTLATLEEVLTATSGWSAEVDEGFRSLLVTQDVTAPLPSRGWTALLWNPVALADPLTRRARTHARHPRAALDAPRRGDDMAEALRRLGAPDALRLAASPRTVDLDGWARPDGVVVRTSRVAVAERDDVVCPPPLPLTPTAGGDPLLGLLLDPGGRDGPVAARVVAERPTGDHGLTELHEPAPAAPAPRRPELLTPTDLADDPLAVADGDALRLSVDGALLVGAEAAPPAHRPLPYAPPGAEPVLRFADAGRPGPGEEWTLALAAVRSEPAIGTTLLRPDPPAGVEDTNAVVVRAALTRDTASLEVTAAGGHHLPGAVCALRVERTAGRRTTWRRAAAGGWTGADVVPHEGEPVSGTVAVTVAGGTELARLARVAVPGGPDVLVLARRRPDEGAWTSVPLATDPLPAPDRPGTVWLDPGPAALLVPDGEDLLLAAPGPDGTATRAWRLGDLTAAEVSVVLLDTGAGQRPGPREAAAGCLWDGTLVLHGGEHHDAVLRDLWQLHLDGPRAGRWVQRRVRDPLPRSGGQLVPGAGGLVRVGGATGTPGLCGRVHRVDLTAARPRWEALADLPDAADGAPGTLVAHHDGTGLRVLVWADRTRPRTLVLADGSATWRPQPPEEDAPHPPAEGEAVVVDGDVHLVGPSPLPPSEVLVPAGGTQRLVFLPALDPRGRTADAFLLETDGTTRTWFPPGTPARARLRLGRGRETGAPRGRQAPPHPRVGAPGRLAWRPLQVRQVSLGPWDQPLALRLDDTVGLDPRLGRVALPAALAGVRPAGRPARFAASYHVARGAALGAGFAPGDRSVPDRWREPAPADGALGHPAPPEAAGRRARAHVVVAAPGRTAGLADPVVTDLAPALDVAAAAGTGDVVVAVVGSPRLTATTGVLREAAVTSVAAWDPGSYPYVEAGADGTSLSLAGRAAPGGAPERGPHLFLTGLALGGTLDLALTSGLVDLRWCDLGLATGGAGVRVAGAGHHTALLRSTPAAPRLVLRLLGCLVARLEVPPWVQVVAAGCTFDAGDRSSPAVRAAGARLRLRECTVRGGVEAGVLQATACVFAGPVTCDRPDLGWWRRCVGGTAPDRRPASWRGVAADVSFAEGRPTWPRYLVLDDNNAAEVLTAGEHGRPPGAHADRGRRNLELAERTGDFLPLGLVAHHVDRAAHDVHRMGRSLS